MLGKTKGRNTVHYSKIDNLGDSSILAGAGSGKTLVLVEKVALLVEKLHVPLEKILVVTFTEKAAGEIKERIAKRLRMTADDLNPLPVGTIHAMANTGFQGFGNMRAF